MKSKKINGKLCLNKKTIANMNNNEMKVIYGGTIQDTRCVTCPWCPWTHLPQTCDIIKCPKPVTD